MPWLPPRLFWMLLVGIKPRGWSWREQLGFIPQVYSSGLFRMHRNGHWCCPGATTQVTTCRALPWCVPTGLGVSPGSGWGQGCPFPSLLALQLPGLLSKGSRDRIPGFFVMESHLTGAADPSPLPGHFLTQPRAGRVPFVIWAAKSCSKTFPTSSSTPGLCPTLSS